jgi:hypothetical protein
MSGKRADGGLMKACAPARRPLTPAVGLDHCPAMNGLNAICCILRKIIG